MDAKHGYHKKTKYDAYSQRKASKRMRQRAARQKIITTLLINNYKLNEIDKKKILQQNKNFIKHSNENKIEASCAQEIIGIWYVQHQNISPFHPNDANWLAKQVSRPTRPSKTCLVAIPRKEINKEYVYGSTNHFWLVHNKINMKLKQEYKYKIENARK